LILLSSKADVLSSTIIDGVENMAEKEYLNEDLELKLLQELDEDEAEMYSRKCAICGRRQFRFILPPKEVEIELWMWFRKCWKCGKETPVVWTPHSVVGEFSIDPDSFKELPKRISEIYPFFKLTYSKTMEENVYGNLCVNCGAYQGNWFVREESLEIAYEPNKIAEKRKLKIILTEQERLERAFPEEVLKLEKHHISYDPEKTIFVCRNCHLRIHHTNDFPHLKPKG